MKLRWTGDDRIMRGATALDCLRYHCHGDHTSAGRSGDVDGVMKRLAEAIDAGGAERGVREDRS